MKSAKIIYDIIWMIIAILLASFLTVVFDLHEWLIQYTRPFESWELDEIPFLLFFVALSCAWFAYRRCRELITEIAERSQIQKALTDSETRYRTLVEASAQGIYIYQEGTVRFANRALGRLFGYESAEALIGEAVEQLYSPHARGAPDGPQRCRFGGPCRAVSLRMAWRPSGRRHTLARKSSAAHHVGRRTGLDGYGAGHHRTQRQRARTPQDRLRHPRRHRAVDGGRPAPSGGVRHLWRDDAPLAEDQLGRGRGKLRQAIVETRRLMTQLRPVSLETLGLIPAVQQYLNELGKDADWEIDYHAEVAALNLSPDGETALFRILQEALTNAWKHAQTSMVRLSLHTEGEKDNLLVVCVQDWGIGFVPARIHSDAQGVGLMGMRERARQLGGVCSIESRPGHGTTVRLRIPLQHGEAV